jgi:hypothetical protein
MSRIIEVIVSPTGETTVQTKGYSGADCLQASKFLEQALGIVAADLKTAEFYQSSVGEQHIGQYTCPLALGCSVSSGQDLGGATDHALPQATAQRQPSGKLCFPLRRLGTQRRSRADA